MSDRDPIRDLENFSLEGDSVHPLPAPEVRRRGDRLRRRRQGLVAAGAAAAVVLIAAPLAYVANGTGRADLDPDPAPTGPSETQSPTADWLDRVPDDFPLAKGWPKPESAGGGEATEEQPGSLEGPARTIPPLQLSVCGKEVDPATKPADRLTAQLVQSYGRWREVRLFADDTAAQAHLDAVRAAYQACPRHDTGGGTGTLHQVKDLDRGDDGFEVEVGFDDNGDPSSDVRVLHVVRVGNGVLIEDGSARGPDIAQVAAKHLTQLKPPLDAMCAFAADPCSPGSGQPSPDTGQSSEIPAGFPLNRGQENIEDGSTPTPTRSGTGVLPVLLCGEQHWPAGPADRLMSTAEAPEHVERRELATFADAAAAVDVMSRLRAAVRDCPQEPTTGPGGEQTNWLHTELVRDLGYDSLSWSRALEGGQALGLQVHQLVRVGNAIVALSLTSEGTQRDAETQVDELTSYSRELAQEMCVFTEAGC